MKGISLRATERELIAGVLAEAERVLKEGVPLSPFYRLQLRIRTEAAKDLLLNGRRE